MSLPRYKVTMLVLCLGIAGTFVGCSSNPAKKEVVDLGPQSSEQAYFDSAEQALNKGQYNEAAKNLQAIDTYFPTGTHAQKAQLDLIYVKFQQKDYPGVVTAADRFIRLNPDHPNVAYAYYARGVANMEQNYDGIVRYTSLKQSHRDVNYLKLAYQNFVDLIRRFPSSQYSVDAAQRMKYIGQELSEHEMTAARFNIERKAWVAAIERSQWVVEHYPDTPQVPEALATIAYSYNQLGDTQSAQQYINVLKLNYPNLVKANGSVNLAAARKQGSWWNKATLGIFGRSSESSVHAEAPHNDQVEKRSWTNRLSFGMLDKPEQEQTAVPVAAPEPVAAPVTPSDTKPKRSWTNRLSFGLLDKPESN